MNKKKIVIIIIAVLSIISIAYILIMLKKSPTTSPTSPGKPELVQKYKGKYSTTLSLDKNQFNFPSELPLLEAAPSKIMLSQEYVKKIATSLELPGDPTVINDTIDGTTYFWKKDASVLFAYLKSGKMSYESGSFSPGTNKRLSDTEVLSITQNFVSQHYIFENSSFQTSRVKYLKQIPNAEGFQETDKINATLFQVGIFPKSSDYEFLSTNSVEPSSYVDIKQDGSVYSFQIKILPSIQKGVTLYKMKNYDQVKASLEDAILIEVRGKTQLLSDMSSNSIESININKIEIAYLIESDNQTSYQPVYKLTGDATLLDSQEKYIATLYLPAFSLSSP